MRARLRSGPRGLTALMSLALAGCELQEVTVVEIEHVVVVEAYALVGVPSPGFGVDNRLWVFLGATVGGEPAPALDEARVEVRRSRGGRIRLQPVPIENCISDRNRERPGSCYDAGFDAISLRPGDDLTLVVRLPDGRVLEADTRIPGDFQLESGMSECALPPDTPFELRWTASDGARAYVAETRIDGLDVALSSEGIAAPDELYLLGLSVSAADTTIVFPTEFGVFDRFELDQALTVRLQRGLPEGSAALVGISAADENYVNWARGGTFNPSGQVRIPSVRGDGTGVFASLVMRRFGVFVTAATPDDDVGPCPGTS
jgi:hypothetical protein